MRLTTLSPTIFVLIFASIFSANCGLDESQESASLAPSTKIILPEGKADNYFSNTAQEYLASAQMEIMLDQAKAAGKSADEKLALANELMVAKTRQVSWFLHVYLIDKSKEDPEVNYGGLRTMVMYQGEQNKNLRLLDEATNKYTYDFSVQVGGQLNLLEKIRQDKQISVSGPLSFPLSMAKMENDLLANFITDDFSPGQWSPLTCNCQLETVNITVEPIARSADAYLDYANMLDDNVMDIGLHFGWDYHARNDLTHARTIYQLLTTELGFTSPVESYEKLNRLSGPLTKKTKVNSRDITIQVSIFRPDPCDDFNEAGENGTWVMGMDIDESYQNHKCQDFSWTDPKANANSTTDQGASNMMQDLKNSLRTRDAIIFVGHSGYTYGFSLGNWHNTAKGDLDPTEIRQLDLPAAKSQIILMSGCETYHTALAFKENSNKAELRNLDVITTSSFSDGTSTIELQTFLRALTTYDEAEQSKLTPSYGRLISAMNINQLTEDKFAHYTMYGVHGIDDNPRLHPLADISRSCKPCASDADCGALGNVCVQLNAEQKVCATDCLSDEGCRDDQVCRAFGSVENNKFLGSACVPRDLLCPTAQQQL